MTTTQPPPLAARTFRGHDPDTALASPLSISTPTKCQARTRLYRNGKMVGQGFPVADISEYLRDKGAVIWLDLRDPDREDLAVLSEEFGLHPCPAAARESPRRPGRVRTGAASRPPSRASGHSPG